MDMAAVWSLRVPACVDVFNQPSPPGAQRAVSDECAASADSRPVCGGETAAKSRPALLTSPFHGGQASCHGLSQVRRIQRTPVN